MYQDKERRFFRRSDLRVLNQNFRGEILGPYRLAIITLVKKFDKSCFAVESGQNSIHS